MCVQMKTWNTGKWPSDLLQLFIFLWTLHCCKESQQSLLCGSSRPIVLPPPCRSMRDAARYAPVHRVWHANRLCEAEALEPVTNDQQTKPRAWCNLRHTCVSLSLRSRAQFVMRPEPTGFCAWVTQRGTNALILVEKDAMGTAQQYRSDQGIQTCSSCFTSPSSDSSCSEILLSSSSSRSLDALADMTSNHPVRV